LDPYQKQPNTQILTQALEKNKMYQHYMNILEATSLDQVKDQFHISSKKPEDLEQKTKDNQGDFWTPTKNKQHDEELWISCPKPKYIQETQDTLPSLNFDEESQIPEDHQKHHKSLWSSSINST
jgi:hypothetical protein